jgi:hypothetical protein
MINGLCHSSFVAFPSVASSLPMGENWVRVERGVGWELKINENVKIHCHSGEPLVLVLDTGLDSESLKSMPHLNKKVSFVKIP